MRHFSSLETKHLARLVILAGAVAGGVALAVNLVNDLAQQRLIRKMNRCVDALQRVLPKVEHAADLYIEECEYAGGAYSEDEDEDDVIRF